MKENVIVVQSSEDRRQLAAILTANGYTVRPVRLKKGKSYRVALEFCREDVVREEDGRKGEHEAD